MDQLSLNIPPGEIYGLPGPDWAGQTTTISMVCGLLAPEAGRITIDGMSFKQPGREIRSRPG